MNSQSLTVICPCYNEAEGIGYFYESVKRVLVTDLDYYRHTLIFVDDASKDDTLSILKRLEATDDNILVMSFSRNFGHQIALSAGLNNAHGDAVIVMDSDMQHPPTLLPEMVKKWETGSEVVLAVRNQTQDANCFKNLSSTGFYSIFNRLSETKLIPGAADFYLLSRKAHQALLQMPERHRFLRAMVAWMGFTPAIVSFNAPPRYAGQSAYTLWRMLAFAATALVSFTSYPVRMAAKLGMGITLLGVLYMLYVMFRHFVLNDLVTGWASIVCVVVILGGTQLTFIGLIGEYLIRVLEEVKRRPLYILKYQSPAIMKTQSELAIQAKVTAT